MIPKTINIRGTGIKDLKATLIKQNGRVAMYLRNDGYYEVGIIKRVKTGHIFPNGYEIKAGDFTYWSNEDFGSIAKTTKYIDVANRHYDIFDDNINHK